LNRNTLTDLFFEGTGSPAKSSSASPARKSKKNGSHRSRSSSNEPDFIFGSPAKRFPILSNPTFEEDEEEEEDDDVEGFDNCQETLLNTDNNDDEKSDHEVGDEEVDEQDVQIQVQDEGEQEYFDSDFDYYIRYGHDEVPMRRETETFTYNENAMLKT